MKNVTISILAVLAFLSPPSASAQTEMGVEHDFSVYGAGGTAADPNVEIKGFTVFGSTQSAYTGAVVGPGNVVVNGVLAVSSGAYFVGNSTFTGAGKIFINDGSTGQLLRRNAVGYLEWSDASALGDNLGNHIATTTLQMEGYGVNTSSDITAARYQINGSTVLAVLPGVDSLGIGPGAGRKNTGNTNLFVGSAAGWNNSSAWLNTFVGSGAGELGNGLQNTFIGGKAGRGVLDDTASRNTFVGAEAGQANYAHENTFVGAVAGYTNTAAAEGTFVGAGAGYYNTRGVANSFMGYRAGYNNTTGAYNSIIGNSAGYFTRTGSANAMLGAWAGYGVNSFSFSSCTLVGYAAGGALTTGNDNIFIGWQAGNTVTTGTGNIIIGYNKTASAASANNEINIGGVYKGNILSETATIPKFTVQAADSGITLTSSDFGKTITVNSASAQTINLPAVTAADIGATITVVKLGAGKVTIDAPASTYIADSTASGTIYNNAQSPAYAAITLRLVTATRWIIVSGDGAWITT